MLSTCLEHVRNAGPLIHCVTNYVTVNDCANALLAAGGSPIMADDPAEVEEITGICAALAVNIGTLNQQTIPAMLLAAARSAELGHPLILDPVGAGASALRTNTALRLLETAKFTAVRGNISEIKALAGAGGGAKGVDADVADRVTEENLDQAVAFAREFARRRGLIVAITGAIDIVADAKTVYLIRNGHPMMSRITGTGCMLTAVMAAYLAANPQDRLEAAAAAVAAMGLCGQLAYAKMMALEGGNSTLRDHLIDGLCNLTGPALEAGALVEKRA